MLDYQRVVDDLISAACSASPETADMLRTSAADYAVACDEVNERLRECGKLLRKGLRAEAIHRAEIEPNLLDIAAVLDFPDREQVFADARRYGIVKPRELALEIAAELNEAYALQQPLETLLKQTRLQAISLSPLGFRIKTLRKIAALDGNNPIWNQDLAEFEKVRLKDIQREANQAIAEHNLTSLAELSYEVLDSHWIELPPKALTESLKRSLVQEQRRNARNQLEQIELKLNEAFAAFDVAAGRRWRDEWNSHLDTAQLERDAEVFVRAEPALCWLEEEDERARNAEEQLTAIAKLDRMLDSDRPISELERLTSYHAATRHGAIPEQLERRYQQVSRSAEVVSTRRARLAIAAAVTTIIALTVAGVIFVQSRNLQHEIAERNTTVKALIDEGKLAEATAYFAELSSAAPNIARADSLQAQKVRLDGLVRDEQQRAAAFAEAMKRAADKGPETPDDTSLNQAEKLARSTAEKAQVARFKADVARVRREMQSSRDQEFNDALVKLAERIHGVEGAEFADAAAGRSRIEELRSEARALEGRSGMVSEAVRTQLKPLTTRLDSLMAAVNSRDQETLHLQEVSRSIGHVKNYQSALAAYVRQFPEHARTADFSQAVAEEAVWEMAASWNSAAAEWNRLRSARPGSSGYEQLKTAGAALSADEFARMTDSASVRQQLLAGEAAVEIAAKRKEIVDNLMSLFTDKLVDGVYIIEFQDGRRYYSPRGVEAQGQRFDFYVDFEMNTKPKLVQVTGELKRNELAPQNKTARAAVSQLGRIPLDANDGSAERVFVELLRIVASDQDTDPLLKFSMLKRILSSAVEISPVLMGTLRDRLAQMERVNADLAARWMLPIDTYSDKSLESAAKDADTARKQAAAALAQFSDLPSVADEAVKKIMQAESLQVSTFIWIGSLHRDTEGQWRCVTKPRPEPVTGTLVAFTRSEPAGQLMMTTVGRCQAGVPKVECYEPAALLEGRPVWLVVGK